MTLDKFHRSEPDPPAIQIQYFPSYTHAPPTTIKSTLFLDSIDGPMVVNFVQLIIQHAISKLNSIVSVKLAKFVPGLSVFHNMKLFDIVRELM